MGYAVLHMEKAIGSDSGMSAHIERTIAPKNADASRTHLNREMITFPDGVTNRTEAIQYRLETAGLQRKIGKNQVRAVRILLTGSPDDIKRIEQAGKLDDWCRDNLDWLKKTYGAENIVSAVVHLDETTPHIHATMIPIVTGERRKAKAEQATGEKKKKYRKKSPDAIRLCADDVMSRVRLKEYQNTYAEQMAKYGLQRGIDGSEAKHITTSQYYRDLLTQSESVQVNITDLLEQKQQAEQELSKVKADISKEKLKNSAADVGSKLMDGMSSILGTPKVVKTDMQNRELKAENTNLSNEIAHLKADIEAQRLSTIEQNRKLHEDYTRQIATMEQRHKVREQELTAENNSLKRTIFKLMGWIPLVSEMLRMEKLCTAAGFTVEQISQLLKGVAVKFSGSLYSEEHNRRFETENSTAKVAQDSTRKLHLTIDENPITDWFRCKQKEFLHSIGVNIKDHKNNRGVKM